MTDIPIEQIVAGYADPEFQRSVLAWHDFLWTHLGRRVGVTFEQAGIERTYEGIASVHADGSYSLDSEVFWPADAGRPIRWAALLSGEESSDG